MYRLLPGDVPLRKRMLKERQNADGYWSWLHPDSQSCMPQLPFASTWADASDGLHPCRSLMDERCPRPLFAEATTWSKDKMNSTYPFLTKQHINTY